MSDDLAYYLRLVAGAEFLAEKSVSPGERAEHLKMADVYRGRARDASVPASDTIH